MPIVLLHILDSFFPKEGVKTLAIVLSFYIIQTGK